MGGMLWWNLCREILCSEWFFCCAYVGIKMRELVALQDGVINSYKEHSFVHSIPYGCHAMPSIRYAPVVLSAVTIIRKLNLTTHLLVVPSQRIRDGIPVLHSNQRRYLLHCSTETVWPATIPGCNSWRYSVSFDSD